jgi:hypothetical protein
MVAVPRQNLLFNGLLLEGGKMGDEKCCRLSTQGIIKVRSGAITDVILLQESESDETRTPLNVQSGDKIQ